MMWFRHLSQRLLWQTDQLENLKLEVRGPVRSFNMKGSSKTAIYIGVSIVQKRF